ncbi:MAG TPA: DUF2272 domain-containing protein [Dongiaceae bacterium]|jgi:hypothetical protein|nr:DUF2272 domain-containing protein [Dongiaceae bacterium]
MSGTWRRFYLMALLGSALAACAVQPAVRRPPVDPALVKGNILRLADAEWNAFGGQIVYLENGRERIDPVGIWEEERRGSPRIGQYWRSVAEDWSGYDCDKPWSAAFISWLMLEAGVPPELFTPSGLHADYLRAIAAGETDPNARFALRDARLFSPRPATSSARPAPAPASPPTTAFPTARPCIATWWCSMRMGGSKASAATCATPSPRPCARSAPTACCPNPATGPGFWWWRIAIRIRPR